MRSIKNVDDLNEKITQILNDPGSIQQIAQIANALGGQQAQAGPDKDGAGPLASPEMLADISKLLRQAEKKDKKQEALFQALRPYLKPNRQARLDRAMQIAHLSHLAGAAFRSGKDAGEEHEEVSRHV